MILDFFKKDLQSTKWGRMRVDDDLIKKINQIKENETNIKPVKIALGIQSTVDYSKK